MPPAAVGGVLFIIYEFGFLRQNLYRAAQSILETGQTAVCKCCQAGKKHSQYCNIQYIAHPANAHCPLKLLGFFTYHLHAVQQQPDRYTCCCCASASCFLDAGGVFAFELGIGAIAAASALTRLMNRDRSLPGRQEAIAQNLITKGTALHKNFQFFNQSNMN